MVIRLGGVKRVVAKGRVYYYHRKTLTRLPGLPGSPEFMAALARLEAKKAPAPLPGRLGDLIRLYRASPEFARLADRTRADYQKVFDYLKPLDGLPLMQVDAPFLYRVRDKAAKNRNRRFVNYLIQVLRLVFNWARRRSLVRHNPAAAVDTIRRPRDARTFNRPWTAQELEVVLGAAPADLRIAIALGAFLGLREADALRVTWAAYDGNAFEVRQNKTGEPVWIPAHQHLREILSAAKRRSPTIVTGARGRPLTATGFRSKLFRFLRKLRDDGKVGHGLTFHGLRHTLGTRLAEAGCDTRTIAAVLGQATLAMAEHYSRKADRARLARGAIARLERQGRRTKRGRTAENVAENWSIENR